VTKSERSAGKSRSDTLREKGTWLLAPALMEGEMRMVIAAAAMMWALPASAGTWQGQVSESREIASVQKFCHENPDAESIPVAYTGERPHHEWRCLHGRAVYAEAATSSWWTSSESGCVKSNSPTHDAQEARARHQRPEITKYDDMVVLTVYDSGFWAGGQSYFQSKEACRKHPYLPPAE